MSDSQGWQPAKPVALVVDDLKVNRVVLSKMFQRLGFEVAEAENGRQALAFLSQNHSKVVAVFLDLSMPVLDGWSTARQLRSLEQQWDWRRLPVVACSADSCDHVINGVTVGNLCHQSGFDAYVGKPLSLHIIVQLLKKYIPGFSYTPPSTTDGAPPRPGSAAARFGVDRHSASKLQEHTRDVLCTASADLVKQSLAEDSRQELCRRASFEDMTSRPCRGGRNSSPTFLNGGIRSFDALVL
ncbi:hypothetical protein WJX72_012493 [[Myrmecia] bisecta]|uniref:histidine kinase n=1 Tax=[Myrmecia] bisecta TaxID=41462 RepID=A0AAW1PEU3_9CHLO